jgi:hypothetical protein
MSQAPATRFNDVVWPQAAGLVSGVQRGKADLNVRRLVGGN